MPDLAELQMRMRDAVLGGSAEPLAGVVADDRLGHARRLNVHRNNTAILLTEALAANFPIVHALVGEAFFAALAADFIPVHPPRDPCLFAYGRNFPDHVAAHPGTAQLPYLADVARMEWAVNEALYAQNAPALPPTALARVDATDHPRLTFTAHPALRIVASAFPIHAIWSLHQPDANPDETVDLNRGGEAVLITRPGADVWIAPLEPAALDFTRDLGAGVSLGRAFARADAASHAFDGAQALAALIAQGAFSACALD